MHADRVNRVALLVFGLLVLAVGLGALAMSVGLFGKTYSHHALFANFISRYIGRHGQWLWPAAAALGVIVALLALRWILTLFLSTDRSGDLEMPGQRRTGRTMVKPSALTTAVTTEIQSYRGVASAKARTLGDPAAARLQVDVTMLRGADIAGLTQRIDTEALAHARAAMGRDDLPIRLDITVGSKAVNRL